MLQQGPFWTDESKSFSNYFEEIDPSNNVGDEIDHIFRSLGAFFLDQIDEQNPTLKRVFIEFPL